MKNYMTQEQFTAMVNSKWNAAYEKLNADWKKNKRKRKTLGKLIAIADYLWDNQGPDAMFMQSDIAQNVRTLGFHEYFEGRIPENIKDAIGSSLRNVRRWVMTLRINYGFPILSVSHCNQPNKDAGYWIARTQEEVDAFLASKNSEDSAVIKRRLDSSDARRTTWNITEDPFRREKKAWNLGEAERIRIRKQIQARISKVDKRESSQYGAHGRT